MGYYICFSTAIIFLSVVTQFKNVYAQTACVPRQAEYGIVCVCNTTYCDFPGPVELPTAGQILRYMSSEAGDRFRKKTYTFTNSSSAQAGDAILVSVNRTQTFQKMFGFGGAMSDSAAINIMNLSHATQQQLIKSYFSSDGNEYTLVRVPMAGSDFSTHAYSYDDYENDETLENFNLTLEDLDFKIPLLKMAQEMSPNRLNLFTAPWSSPKWMKTNNEFNGEGYLKTEYYELWAQYFVKFLQAYSEHGLEFWAISTGNEPNAGCRPTFRWNSICWTVEEQRDWVANNLGPALQASDFSDINLLILDDQRLFLPGWIDTMLSNTTVKQYVAGVAVHWYTDTECSPNLLDQTHENWPDIFLLYTESCTGVESLGEISIAPGSWERGEKYLRSIIETSNHWVSGWTDWNMALSLEGGPNWAGNMDDSPIHVNSTGDEFYKQPMFYAMGHFSKFVPEGSTRIGLNVNGLEGAAFIRPDGATVVVLINTQSDEITAVVVDAERGELVLNIPAKSFHTLIWQ